jgi:hypothetical protein
MRSDGDKQRPQSSAIGEIGETVALDAEQRAFEGAEGDIFLVGITTHTVQMVAGNAHELREIAVPQLLCGNLAPLFKIEEPARYGTPRWHVHGNTLAQESTGRIILVLASSGTQLTVSEHRRSNLRDSIAGAMMSVRRATADKSTRTAILGPHLNQKNPKEPIMDLDIRQTRRLYLAGTVAFPMPFPATGVISIEHGSLPLSPDCQSQHTTFVVVQDSPGHERSTLRIILAKDVAAIFFPGAWETDSDQSRVFRFKRNGRVEDFERGEWFLNPEIDAKKILDKLNSDVTRRDSDARGVVFVPENRPVLSISEVTQTAGSICDVPVSFGCECECQCECT